MPFTNLKNNLKLHEEEILQKCYSRKRPREASFTMCLFRKGIDFMNGRTKGNGIPVSKNFSMWVRGIFDKKKEIWFQRRAELVCQVHEMKWSKYVYMHHPFLKDEEYKLMYGRFYSDEFVWFFFFSKFQTHKLIFTFYILFIFSKNKKEISKY